MVRVHGALRAPRRKVVWGCRMIVVMFLLVAALAAAPGPARAQPTQTPAAQEGFVPAKDLPSPQDQMPAAPLVMIAYALAWAAILVYMWSIWMRLNRVQREIADVSRRVEAGARR